MKGGYIYLYRYIYMVLCIKAGECDKEETLLLLRGVVGEVNTLADVPLQAVNSYLEQRLLVVVQVGQRAQGLLGTVGLHGC
jgi:hypothetical protein